ncbi:MAG: hypothetical protein WCT77_14935, partial [Bacteroidota bacterium]
MKKIKIIFIVIIIMTSKELYSQCDSNNAVFASNPENVRYLKYFNYLNRFDSASVMYTFGETRICTDSTTERILLKILFDSKFVYYGDSSTQGVDNILTNVSETNTFVYSRNSRIKFFRKMSKIVPCGVGFGGGGGSGEETFTDEDYFWYTGQNRISDHSQWVLQLLKTSDRTVVFTVDSVGIAPNPDSILALRYGTNPTLMNHEINLPNEWADSSVFLRIQIYRTGPTPYVMEMKILSYVISSSTNLEYIHPLNNKCSDQEWERLEEKYFFELLTYCDSVKINGGRLESELTLSTQLNSSQDSIFLNRYYDYVCPNNNCYWKEKDTFYFNPWYISGIDEGNSGFSNAGAKSR